MKSEKLKVDIAMEFKLKWGETVFVFTLPASATHQSHHLISVMVLAPVWLVNVDQIGLVRLSENTLVTPEVKAECAIKPPDHTPFFPVC